MKTITAHGVSIPALGLGTWELRGETAERIVREAVARGYRHVDTARIYGNETEVGAGLRASGVARDAVFVTTKIWPTDFHAEALLAAARDSARALGVGPVDLLLLHWPNPRVPLAETIDALNRARAEGLTRHVGVSNFTVALLDRAAALSEAPIVANQVEYHPFLDQSKLLAGLRRHGTALTAYCPVARGRVIGEPIMKRVAAAHAATETQVALAWLLAQDVVAAIPRSHRLERVMENFHAQEIRLSPQETAEIATLARPGGRITQVAGFAPDWD